MPSQRPVDYAESLYDPRSGRGASELDPEQNRILQEYLRDGGIHLNPAQTAWCAAYTNASLGKAGLPIADNPMGARGLLKWGRETMDPHRGDVVVAGRSDPAENRKGLGHAGFFEGFDPRNPDNLLVLGGNTGDEVNIASIPRERVLGFRRPALEDDMAMAMRLGDRQDIPSPGQNVDANLSQKPQTLADIFGFHTHPQPPLRPDPNTVALGDPTNTRRF